MNPPEPKSMLQRAQEAIAALKSQQKPLYILQFVSPVSYSWMLYEGKIWTGQMGMETMLEPWEVGQLMGGN
jgi:hypothetical protein